MINKGEVPEGYKKTKVGVIPNDWVVKTFDELFYFNGGYPIPRNKLGEEGICYLHYGDIHTHSSNFIDVAKEKDSLPKVPITINEIKNDYLLDDGDIVFVDASEDLEGIGKSITIYNESAIPFIAGLHTIVAKDRKKALDKGFKRYFLLNFNVRKQLMFYATGISVFGISRDNIKKIEVGVPHLLEQQKIGQILSIWDKAIELKEQLIEEKKEQKKGLMQRLLTGKVRLSGFDEEWKEVKLEEIVEKTKGKAVANDENGRYPVIGIEYFQSGIFENFSNDNTVMANEKDVLLLWDGANAGKAFTSISGIVGSTFVKLECKDVNNVYLQKHLELNESFIMSIREGSGIPHVPKDFLSFYKLNLPPRQEQKAIAKVLSTADKEIELLEEELEQLKLQKKGLMQLLLTGIIRVKC